jgi:hypothetical protein
MGDVSPTTSVATDAQGQQSSLKRNRAEVGKIVRVHADSMRIKLSRLVDSAIEGPQEFTECVQDIREEWGDMESALKDWDDLPAQEDSCADLDWRRNLHDLAKIFSESCAKEVDASFPEFALVRRYQRMRSCLASTETLKGTIVGPETLKVLKELQGRNDKSGKFQYEESTVYMTLTCIWKTLMRVTFVLDDLEIAAIRVVADKEPKDVVSSAYDVFRQLEREARYTMRLAWTDGPCSNRDDVLASMINWFNQRRNLFDAKCASTNRHLAFGAVGERGKLEARPPLARSKEGDGLKDVIPSFSGGLM